MHTTENNLDSGRKIHKLKVARKVISRQSSRSTVLRKKRESAGPSDGAQDHSRSHSGYRKKSPVVVETN
jgi:hypothetical protein